jgi:hypothetical protein
VGTKLGRIACRTIFGASRSDPGQFVRSRRCAKRTGFREGDMTKRNQSLGSPTLFKPILKTGVAMMALCAVTPAFAQQAQGPTVAPQPATSPDTRTDLPNPDSIVISGYARSITNANRIKELSVSVVEAISAEDVGKLPDVSISDALSRLPGLAVQQASGRAKYISIRGFGPDYTTAMLNGRMIATVDDNRRFDYSQYPGDLFQEIDVIKTPSADLLNQGLAGTVNLQTYDPLKSKKSFSVNVQGEIGQYKSLNPEGSNKGYKVSSVYVDKFADDTIGLSLGFRRSRTRPRIITGQPAAATATITGPAARTPRAILVPTIFRTMPTPTRCIARLVSATSFIAPAASLKCRSTRFTPSPRPANIRAAGKCRWQAGARIRRSPAQKPQTTAMSSPNSGKSIRSCATTIIPPMPRLLRSAAISGRRCRIR